MEIIKSGKYQTNGGHAVKIYEIYEESQGYDKVVHGAFNEDGNWHSHKWNRQGRTLSEAVDCTLDLISVYKDFKIDDPVWVWNSEDPNSGKYPAHYAGLSKEGYPQVWMNGKTSHTAVSDTSVEYYCYCSRIE